MDEANKITYIGSTDFRGKEQKFGIKPDDRTRHMYIIGKTGMGKSTLLENMAIQDIQNGEGLCFVDPHGSSAEKLLRYVPEHRIKDVVYFAPFDNEYPIALNILEHVEESKRHLVASGLMDAFKKVFGEDQFSGRMVYLLLNAILSLLENEGESLMGINRIFSDKEYRKKIISNVKDPAVLAFWNDEFAKYTDKYVQEATPAIQNKIGQFISNPVIRNIVGQKKTSFDVREIMDNRKILICNLSIGLTGKDNIDLIGSLLITKIFLAALSRADMSESQLRDAPPFYFYVDEFQNFVNDSFAQILSQARKYKLGLIVAHQYIDQLDDAVKSAVFGNVGTMISFRVGATDAEVLEKEFAPAFTADDIVNLARFQMYLRLSIDGVGSRPFSARSLPTIVESGHSSVPAIIAHSRALYGKAKSEAQLEIASWYEPITPQLKFNPEQKKSDYTVRDTLTHKKPSSFARADTGPRDNTKPSQQKPNQPNRNENRNQSRPDTNNSVKPEQKERREYQLHQPHQGERDENRNQAEQYESKGNDKSNNRKDKPKQNFALRDALQTAIGSSLLDTERKVIVDNRRENNHNQSNNKNHNNRHVQGYKPHINNEIPKEVLKRIIDIEE